MTHLKPTHDFLRTTYRVLISLTLAALIIFMPLEAPAPRPAHAWSATAQGSISPSAPFPTQPIHEASLSAAAYPESAAVDIASLDVTSQILSAPLDPSQAAQLLESDASETFVVATGGIRDDGAASVAVTTDAGYIVAGVTRSFGASGSDVLLLKYARDGTLSWARTTGGSGDDRAYSVAVVPDGGYIVAGSTESFGAGGSDVLLLKYTADGTLSWARTAGSWTTDEANSVAITGDGGYIVAGYTFPLGETYHDVLLIKFTGDGAYSWARIAGGSDRDIARSVTSTLDGGYIVAGLTDSYSVGITDVLLLKYDINGTLSWARTAGGSYWDEADSVAQTADGGYIVAGYNLLLKYTGDGTFSWARTSAQANSVVQTADGGYILAGDNLLFKYAADATISWARTLAGDASSVAVAADGGYIVAGSTSYGAGSFDVLLMKTDANGYIRECPLCAPYPLMSSSPNLSLSSPIPPTGTPVIISSLHTLSSASPSPENAFICGEKPFLAASGGSAMDMANSVAQTADGGYIVAGQTSSYGAGGYDVFLLKYAVDGRLSWARTTGGGSNDIATSVVVDDDEGGFLVAGYTGSFGAGGYDVMLLKYTRNGTLSWARTAGGSGDDRAYSVAAQYTGYIVAGRTTSYGAGDNDVLLLKYDDDGTLSWAWTAGGSGDDRAYSVVYDLPNYILAGSTTSFGAGGSDVLLLKYAWDGTLSWARTAGGSNSDTAFSVAWTGDGGYIVAGRTDSYGAGNDDALLLRYTSDGTLSWAMSAGGGADDYAQSVAGTADGGYIVAGRTTSYGAGSYDVLLLKYTSLGALHWARTAGGSDWDLANSVAVTIDGGYVVTGFTDSFGAGSYDMLLLKTDSYGEVPDCDTCNLVGLYQDSPTPSTSSPTMTTDSLTPSTSSPRPSSASPSPKNTFVCGWPYDIYLPLVTR